MPYVLSFCNISVRKIEYLWACSLNGYYCCNEQVSRVKCPSSTVCYCAHPTNKRLLFRAHQSKLRNLSKWQSYYKNEDCRIFADAFNMIEETPGIAIVLTILIALSCCVILVMCINCFLGIIHGILKPMFFGDENGDDNRCKFVLTLRSLRAISC